MGSQPKTDIHGNRPPSRPISRRERVELVVVVALVMALLVAWAWGVTEFLVYLSEHRRADQGR